MTATCMQGVGTPAILLVQPTMLEFNKSDFRIIGMPLDLKGLPLLLFSFTTPL